MELGELGDYKSAPSGRPHQPVCLTLCSNIAIVPTPLDHQIRTAQQLRERMVGCNTPTAWV
ncbi:BZ3500_MvSof-1268-A1-R1_Chr8-1g09970 [Microbotryum saponariae]|uniref:BZ3500_MvSof-1268-A1-R1_Chr8-1g09970 protein n=1 Tax=Microbotryum saponariae TaxID=289078 RepID=A0A2X0NPW9_9BASI|nr:BZ3500_MvSof-1268-A1-R1_Chr8-1g09970 [Microbotryum saponariae]SDA08256.1 BZ3501_MvSof-1269-A2-R1_Chr8-1g09693 [Microbotryum saponariae]